MSARPLGRREGRRLVVAGLFAVIAIELALGLASGGGPTPTSAAGRHEQTQLAAGTLLDQPLGRLGLIDEHGRPTSLAAFRGRYLVLAPSLTLCHEVCPLTTGALIRLREMLRAQGLGGRVTVAEATVDPWRDSPSRIRAFKRRTGADVRFLTGTRWQIRRLWRALGVAYRRVAQGSPPDSDWWTHRAERFDVTHTDGVFIIGPGGHLRVAITGMPASRGRLAPRLAALLNDAGRRNLRHPQAPWSTAEVRADLRALMRLPAAAAPVRARQDGALLGGGGPAFRDRLRALRGRPVVVDEWASWCPACRQELPLLAAAASRFGGRTAFVGLDVDDAVGPARRFLAAHPAGYPSYVDPGGRAARALAGLAGLPTTVFLDADGGVAAVHTGQYADAASLDRDIRRYALGRGA